MYVGVGCNVKIMGPHWMNIRYFCVILTGKVLKTFLTFRIVES